MLIRSPDILIFFSGMHQYNLTHIIFFLPFFVMDVLSFTHLWYTMLAPLSFPYNQLSPQEFYTLAWGIMTACQGFAEAVSV